MNILDIAFCVLGFAFLIAIIPPIRTGKIAGGPRVIVRKHEPEHFWLYVFVCVSLSIYCFSIACLDTFGT